MWKSSSFHLLKGTKELLPNEDFGIIYADSENFVETLSVSLQNKEKLNELGMRGYAYVKENHDWSILSNNLLNKFKKTIKDKC